MSNDQLPPTAMLSWMLAHLSGLHPYASTGAAFGCFFFLSVSARLKPWSRLQLLVFSWGIGYAGGIYYNGEGVQTQGAMLVAGVCAALGSAIFTAFYRTIDEDGKLPPWLGSVLDRLPFTKRGPKDGA